MRERPVGAEAEVDAAPRLEHGADVVELGRGELRPADVALSVGWFDTEADPAAAAARLHELGIPEIYSVDRESPALREALGRYFWLRQVWIDGWRTEARPAPGAGADRARRGPPPRRPPSAAGTIDRVTVAVDVKTVGNVIGGEERPAASGATFEKLAPATGEVISLVARSDAGDTGAAIAAAVDAQPAWADRTVEERGRILRGIAQLLERDRDEVAAVVSAETGKSPKDALGETGGAIELGYFIAGEGRRFYGKTMPSATPNRQAMTIRQPLGVAGLIIAANTPIANVAWKVFPALLCGNAAVLKASEDTPETALVFARLAAEAGLPPGRAERRPGLRRGGGPAARRGPARRGRLLHGLDRGRPHDRAGRRRAAREGLPRARRQEPARRLRRREPRARPPKPPRSRRSRTRASAARPARA